MKNPLIAIPFAIITALLMVTNSFALGPDTVWTRTYGGYFEDECIKVCQTLEDGYIFTGWTRSFSNDLWGDVWLVKTDSLGDTLWTRTYGGGQGESGASVQQTSDHGYIIAGGTSSFMNRATNAFVIKTDSLGDSVWEKAYGGQLDEYGNCIKEMPDGGYIVACETGSYGHRAYAIKLDSNGDTLWTKTYGWGYFTSVDLTHDGCYIFTGGRAINEEDVYLLKADSLGNELWVNFIGGADIDKGFSIEQTEDRGYIVAGYTTSFGAGRWDVYVIKTDSLGDTLWTKVYGGADFDNAWQVQQTTDGGYIVVGENQSWGPGSRDIWLLKLDTNGDIVWNRIYGGIEYDLGYSVQQTSDGGYIVGGKTASRGAGSTDAWLLKLAPERIWVNPQRIDTIVREEQAAAKILNVCNYGYYSLGWDIAENPPVNWLSLSPTNGSIDPGEVDSIQIIMDAMNLLEGDYLDTLVLTSNDTICPIIEIPVHLRVDRLPRPNIEIPTANLDFGEAQIGEFKDSTISISNVGDTFLVINDISASSSEGFGCFFPMFPETLLPSGYSEFVTRFSPEQEISYNCTLFVNSNDPNEPQKEITLLGQGIAAEEEAQAPREIRIFPNPFSRRLHIEGCQEVEIFDISGKLICKAKTSWNGKDSRGNPVSMGIYYVKVKNENIMKVVKVR